MSRIVHVLLVWLVLAIQSPFALGQSPAEAERQARAAFVALIDAAGKRDAAKFKKLIAAADLREMEAMEKEKAGFFDMMMSMMDGVEPAKFKAELRPSRVTFTREVVHETPERKGRETVSFTMIREGNQWKFGRAP